MNITEKRRQTNRTLRSRAVALFFAVLMLSGLAGMFAADASADIIGELEPGTTTVLKMKSSLDITYNFSAFTDNELPPEFGSVYYDYVPDTVRRSIHPDKVNYYYTDENRAVYCFEPDNPYIFDDGEYDVLSDIHANSRKASISQLQKDMLAYVLAEGVSEYTGGSDGQIATQLAVWMTGTGYFMEDDPFLEVMLPSSGPSPGVAPNTDIRDEARRLLRVAYERAQGEPSFFKSGGPFEMKWNGSAYSANLTDTKGILTNSSYWGPIIKAALADAGLTGSINDSDHSLTITGDPQAAGTNIPFTTPLKADLVYMNSPFTTTIDGHEYFDVRQEMITLSSLNAGNAGTLRLFRSNAAEVVIPFQKIVSGIMLNEEQSFVFELTELNSADPSDEKDGGIQQTKEVTGAGSFAFDPFEAEEEGVYWFKVQEVYGGYGWNNDTDARVVRVTVTSDPPQADVVYTSGLQVFTNYSPEIRTSAKNAADGSSTARPEKKVKIIDTVRYTNLQPGTEYEIQGYLVDKNTGEALMKDERVIVESVVFIPESSSGTVEVVFEFDASELKDRSLVVFEFLLMDGELVAYHADSNDLGQTIRIADPSPKTGSSAVPVLWAGLMAVSALFGSSAVFYRRTGRKIRRP